MKSYLLTIAPYVLIPTGLGIAAYSVFGSVALYLTWAFITSTAMVIICKKFLSLITQRLNAY